jgi:hypothetical protein
MCLWRAPEKYIAGAALDRAALVGPWSLVNFTHLIHSRQDSLDEGSASRRTAT